MPDAAVVASLRELYETADRFAREVGEFRSEVAIPAHNELRYAGHHLLQSVDGDGMIHDDDHFRKARNHCERAMYEAAEAGILSALDSIETFRNDYKGIVVSRVVDDYAGKIAQARRAQALLVKGRADRTSVTEHVSDYMDTFRELRQVVDTLDAGRDDLNAVKADQISSYRRFVITSLLTLLGILTAAAIGLWRISMV